VGSRRRRTSDAEIHARITRSGASLIDPRANPIIRHNHQTTTPSIHHAGGLAEDCTEEMLHAAFIPFGDIVEVTIPKDFKESEWPLGM